MARGGGILSNFVNGRILAVLVLAVVCHAAAAEQRRYDVETLRYDYEALMYYKTLYGSEIFEYCLTNEHSGHITSLVNCLEGQQRRKEQILRKGQAQLGQRSLAQAIYDDCVDYSTDQGVAGIGHCVDTRPVLRDKLDDEAVEREIYRRCYLKWRKHSAGAINTCAGHAANYYRAKGELRD